MAVLGVRTDFFLLQVIILTYFSLSMEPVGSDQISYQSGKRKYATFINDSLAALDPDIFFAVRRFFQWRTGRGSHTDMRTMY